jgi:hypothetical protein
MFWELFHSMIHNSKFLQWFMFQVSLSGCLHFNGLCFEWVSLVKLGFSHLCFKWGLVVKLNFNGLSFV